MLLQIEQKHAGRYALLHMGFRPFFALAGIFAVLLMLAWTFLFTGRAGDLQPDYQVTAWHAHEMIFGFGLAVVAGFLLTAVRNWTGQDTATGTPLLMLALLWLLARVSVFWPGGSWWAGAFEGLFLLALLLALARPIFRVKQWKQMGILSKMLLFIPASLIFHLGVAGLWPTGISLGLYTGFYLLLALILTLARRVMPMFIERGLNNGFLVRQEVWVDRASLLLFLLLAIVDTLQQSQIIFIGQDSAIRLLAGASALLHARRLLGWYHPAVWAKPMVWILVLAYGWLVLGFVLKALSGIAGVTQSLAVHAFSVGGIALITLGMMARVSLGHTGRMVTQPPPAQTWIFVLVALAPVLRVVAIWLWPEAYMPLIHASQAVWILGFTGFSLLYVPMLMRARIDGLRG